MRTSSDLRLGSVTERTVSARSNALVPVVVLPRMSIETANAVPWLSLFFETINGIRSSSSRWWVTGIQTIPRPCVTMKLIASGVTFSAAITKSPSFSRRPHDARLARCPICEQRLDVLGDHVHLQVHDVAGSRGPERRHSQRV